MVAVSSLSVAIQSFADFLDNQLSEEVVVSVDTPQKASDRAKDSSADILNVFVYRLAPSGVHTAAGHQDRLFVRANALLTVFPRGGSDPEPDQDLRVLGHAMAVLQSFPVIPINLPGAPDGADDFRNAPTVGYRLDAVLQAPAMEELNHIWTTQGGDLGYRLSAAYELALIPIEPLELAETPPPARAAILDVNASATATLGDDGIVRSGSASLAIPLAGEVEGTPPGADWLPLQLFSTPGGLSSARTIAPGTASVEISLVGAPGQEAVFVVEWTRADDTTDTQPGQDFTVAAVSPDDASAGVSVSLTAAADGDRATIRVFPSDGAATPIPDAPQGNVLSLQVEA